MLNYDEVYDELEKSQTLLVKMIKQLNQKGDITPNELANLEKAVCVMEKIIKLDSMIDEAWNDGGDSEYYDDSMMNRGGSYRGGSYARGRSPRTGRYVSRMDGRGMSRHSIEDRMIAALENQMDYAGSDYERQQVGEWIKKMRAEQK